MASITAPPATLRSPSTWGSAAAPPPTEQTQPVAAERVAAEPQDPDVGGPDERSLARTTAAVLTSLVALIGTLVTIGAAAFAGVRTILTFFLT